MKPSFAIIGCGKVGRALAQQLPEAGYRPMGFSSRRITSARAAAEIAGALDRCFEKTWEAAKDADIVFITTPDDAIKESCRIIVENNGFKKKSVVFHCSGALASTELALVKSGNAKSGIMTGVQIGSMHPLQSFAVQKSGNPFDNIMMAVEGDPAAVETAREIVTDLGAQPFTISTDGKMLYHAAAVVASNYLVTLMDLAIKLMAASGVSETEAFKILNPLVKGTLANIESTGIPDALTGPIARGDVEIVTKHVQALQCLSGDMAKYYSLSGIETIKIARAKGSLSEDAAKQMMRIFNVH